MRRVDLVCPPFAGHLHPLLGIGRRLAKDFEVRVLSSESAQREIAAAGLPSHVLLPGRDAEIRAIVEPPHAVGSHPLRLHAQLSANLALLEAFQNDLRRLWAQQGAPSLALVDFTLPIAGTVATEHGIPWWTTHPSPCVIETPDGPPAYLGGWNPGRGLFGKLRDASGRALVRVGKQAAHRLFRAKITRLGLPAIYRQDGSEAVYSPEKIFALGARKLEFERRWPRAVELTGPVLYTPPLDIPPPPFIEGRSHVLVTIGTHLPWMKEEVAAAVRAAAALLPEIQFHFTEGRVDRAEVRGSEGANFDRLGYVSYARDLARYALVVHHGGAGVMYHSLAAGLPSLVFPLDYDQFDHAARLETAGVARRLQRLPDLAREIKRALADEALRGNCADFAGHLAEYDAVETVAARVRERLG